jgi:hypothetical protein
LRRRRRRRARSGAGYGFHRRKPDDARVFHAEIALGVRVFIANDPEISEQLWPSP